MDVNKFVKKFGLDKAKEAIQLKPTDFEDTFKIDKGFIITQREAIKRAVKAFGIVAKFGGLEKAKQCAFMSMHSNSQALNDLKQAIVDVESCQ